jgi:hypothetical protein
MNYLKVSGPYWNRYIGFSPVNESSRLESVIPAALLIIMLIIDLNLKRFITCSCKIDKILQLKP